MDKSAKYRELLREEVAELKERVAVKTKIKSETGEQSETSKVVLVVSSPSDAEAAESVQ